MAVKCQIEGKEISGIKLKEHQGKRMANGPA